MSAYVPSDFDEVSRPRNHGFSRLHVRVLIDEWKKKGRTQKDLADACSIDGDTRSDKAVSDWKSMTSFPSRENFELFGRVIFGEFIEEKDRLTADDFNRLKVLADDLLERSSDPEILRHIRHVANRRIEDRFGQYIDDSEKRLIDPLQKFLPRGISNSEWASVYQPPPMCESNLLEEVPIEKIFANANREFISIIAEGGKGKSTLLRYLRFAAWHQPQAIGLEAPHFPLMILAQAFEALDLSCESDRPIELIVKAFKRSQPPGSWAASNNVIVGVLLDPSIPCLILIDGFTQVPSEIQTRLTEVLYPVFNNFKSGGCKTGLVVAGRKEMVGRFGDVALKYNLLPLHEDYFNRLVVLWAGKGANKFNEILREPERASIDRLVKGNPLFLALALTFFCDNGETLPTNMVDFFENFFCKASGAFVAASNSNWDILKHANSVLGHVAYQQLSKRVELMTEPFIRNAAKFYFRQRPECSSNSLMAMTYAEAFCGLVADNKTVLFQTIGNDKTLDNLPVCYEWIHDMLRDYLASCVLHDQPERLTELVDADPEGEAERWTTPCAFALLMMDSRSANQLLEMVLQERFGVFIALQFLGFGGKVNGALQAKVSERIGEEIAKECQRFSLCGQLFSPFVVSDVGFAVHIEAIRSRLSAILDNPDLNEDTRKILRNHLEANPA